MAESPIHLHTPAALPELRYCSQATDKHAATVLDILLKVHPAKLSGWQWKYSNIEIALMSTCFLQIIYLFMLLEATQLAAARTSPAYYMSHPNSYKQPS